MIYLGNIFEINFIGNLNFKIFKEMNKGSLQIQIMIMKYEIKSSYLIDANIVYLTTIHLITLFRTFA